MFVQIAQNEQGSQKRKLYDRIATLDRFKLYSLGCQVTKSILYRQISSLSPTACKCKSNLLSSLERSKKKEAIVS
jgi:hypothetical protein